MRTYVKQWADAKRQETWELAFDLADSISVRNIIETGTYRGQGGDGCSTPILASYAKTKSARFYSVDNCKAHIAAAKSLLTSHGLSAEFHCMDSVAWLGAFHDDVQFLYLDSLDYDAENAMSSQLHHLAEYITISPHLKERCVMLIDDADLPGGGKAAMLVYYACKHGWRQVAMKYQVLLANF